MRRFAGYRQSELTELADTLEREIVGIPTLIEAAQVITGMLYRHFVRSVVLARFYATAPLRQLPARDRSYARDLARRRQVASRLQEDTVVLSLLGTAGVEAEWNRRELSQGHLALPLVSADFARSIPMIASLMTDMGIGVEWLEAQDTSIVVRKLGQMVGVFYVGDATTTVDAKGRAIVPAQDFVRDYGVKTVFGLGGSYLSGTFISLIFFAREAVERRQVECLMPLISRIKGMTSSLITGSPPDLYGLSRSWAGERR